MNWEVLGAIGELIAAVGVIATLAFLSLQVRQNTRMMRSTIKEQRTASSQQVIFNLVQLTPSIAKLVDGKKLNFDEELAIRLMSVAQHRGYEAYAHQFRNGLYEEDEWEGMLATIRQQLEFDHFRESFSNSPEIFSKQYQDLVTELIAKRGA